MKALEKLQNSTTRENLWMYILSILQENPCHAYILRAKVREKFGWTPALITFYVVLYRIEEEKLIMAKSDERRKVYSVTALGKKRLQEAKNMLKKISALL